jgi:hypothetical protein
VSINKVFLGVNHLLGGGLLGLGGRSLLLLLSRGSTLGSGISLGRGPEGLVGNASQQMNELNQRMIPALTRLSRRSCMMRVESL